MALVATRAQHAGDDRPVEPDQRTVQGIAGFREDAAAHKQLHEHRHQGDRQQRGSAHGEGLGQREWFEQPAFLGLQREHRQERDGNDGKAEKQSWPDLERGIGDDPGAGCAGYCPLEMLVCVLDHDDRSVDHGAQRDRDAAKAHDVRAQP
jgi:hypothetical protein